MQDITKWLETRGLKPNRLQVAQDASLDKLNERCALCMDTTLTPASTMLCNGFRQVLDTEASEYYGYPKLTAMSCAKAISKERNDRIERNKAELGLPYSEWYAGLNALPSRWFAYDLVDGEIIVDLSNMDKGEPEQVGFAVPRYTVHEHKIQLSMAVAAMLLALTDKGFRVKYVDPNIILEEWNNKRYELPGYLDEFDWVYFDKFDQNRNPDFIRQHLLAAINLRRAHNKPFLISMSENATLGLKEEMEFIEETKEWQKFPLSWFLKASA